MQIWIMIWIYSFVVEDGFFKKFFCFIRSYILTMVTGISLSHHNYCLVKPLDVLQQVALDYDKDGDKDFFWVEGWYFQNMVYLLQVLS